eukprot:GILI01021582.1.p1 GENE.GILI01021582.1~~GILI01021582.1.p1  ORF type:complete len:199 (+),score=27.92 GILI01021582.1:53-649(+)
MSSESAPLTPDDVRRLVLSFANVPKLVVFDLDYTLWPLDCECMEGPPFSRVDGDDFAVVDTDGEVCKLYPQVPAILVGLKNAGVKLGVASRTTTPEWAEQIMRLMRIEGVSLWEFFDYHEIFPSNKTVHFHKMANKSNLLYRDMVFFDNEERNIVDVSRIGVTCTYVDNMSKYDGMHMHYLSIGLSDHNNSFYENDAW